MCKPGLKPVFVGFLGFGGRDDVDWQAHDCGSMGLDPDRNATHEIPTGAGTGRNEIVEVALVLKIEPYKGMSPQDLKTLGSQNFGDADFEERICIRACRNVNFSLVSPSTAKRCLCGGFLA